MSNVQTIGFVGLGVMGGPMCRNIAQKHQGRVIAFDLSPEALAALSDTRAEIAASLSDVAAAADILFLSLPGGAQVEAVVSQTIAPQGRAGMLVADLSTTPVAVARRVGALLAEKGIDLPIAPSPAPARPRKKAR